MANQFGKTWWGMQWLNSLANIDYSNRLPRGSNYAKNGSVTSIIIKENNISAKVNGSQPNPYDVTIIIPPFFENDIKKLIKAIALHPIIISKLLNRELDPEILAIANKCGLKVFPIQWTDFKMQCSCPDWAVPCKHLAAVIYKVSAEIDNNPFLAFSLHRVNLPMEFKKENIHIIDSEIESIPLLKSLLTKEKFTEKRTKKEERIKQLKIPIENEFQKLNFSSLVPLHDPLIQLLPDNPVFYQVSGNFRDKYAFIVRKIVRIAQRIIQGKVPIDHYFDVSDKYIKSNISQSKITHNTAIHFQIDGNNKVEVILSSENKPIPLSIIIPELWLIPISQQHNLQPSVVAAKSCLLMTINLIANGAIVPQIVKLTNDKFSVRWLPATISKEVKLLVEKLNELIPNGLFYFDKNEITESTNDSTINLLSIFITNCIHAFAELTNSDMFISLFFSNSQSAFKGPGEQALSGGIQQWLHRYYITQGNYQPVIFVKELKNDLFQIEIQVDQNDKLSDKSASLFDVLILKKYEKIRFEILQSLGQLSSFIPGLDQYINSRGEEKIVKNLQQFAPFLLHAIPAIQLLDISIVLPKSLQHILKPKATIRVKQKTKDSKGFLRLDKLLDFEWQVAIGDTLIGEKEFNELLKKSDGLIKFKTNYIYVGQSELEKLHKHFSSSKELSAFEILRAALSNDFYGAKVSLTDDVKRIIDEFTKQKVIPLPKSLNANLRPYQERGFSWLYRNTKIGFGSVLADDMGLGKTLQVITMLLKIKEEGLLEKEKALIIMPTGLLTNWQSELEKFSPSLKFLVYHGSGRALDKKANFDVLLTSYGVVRQDADILKKIKWNVVITDEAQNIKNHETAQSKAVKSIPSNTFIAMSGTPVENRITELWSIMDFCNRNFLGNIKDFKENFANPIQNENNIVIADKLKAITAPFLMRRLKSDKSIISDLPDKIEMDCFNSLAKEQASLYKKTLQKALEEIEGITTTDHKSLFVRQGLVLQMILALKQICNHPTQFLKNKVLKADLSGKTDLLFEKLEGIIENNEKVLIFTQFTEMGNLLKHFITEKFGQEPMFYHGGCNIKQRKEMVDNFQNNSTEKIFILSLKAAGTGLNLTAANHVIHYDLWWNPAVENQATDRAYRIGQKSNVMVHRFITKGTFEERINEMIQSKKHLANLTVATGENWIGNLNNKELKEMFELG